MKTLSWNAPEYAYAPKTVEWFLASALIGCALVATAAILGDYLFAGVVALAAFLFLLYARRRPEMVAASLTPEGVVFGKMYYPYEELAAFGIEEHAGGMRLLVRKKRRFSLLAAIPIVGIHENLVRAALREYLPEETLHEPLSQKILEYIGF